jgi:hypothetical protein
MILMLTAAWGQNGPFLDQARAASDDRPPLRAGASAVNVSPDTFPVLINGGFLQNKANAVNDPLFARCLVLDDGPTRLAIVVADSCMIPRDLLDRAKSMAREKTGIAPGHILISATHTHTAPASMGALGCPADPAYAERLPSLIAQAIDDAAGRLVPARVGWGVIEDDRHTYCRRWIRRPDRIGDDPFGQRTVRANMHPGYVNPDVISPAGPVDPALTVLSVQTTDGRPLAVLANYSQHYFGSAPVSADYYGRFATALARKLGVKAEEGKAPFVAMMSQGTSGDQMWMDYGQAKDDPGLDRYADEVAQSAYEAYRSIANYRERVPLGMQEATLTLGRRVPNGERLAWARGIVAKMGDRVPQNLPEVYAKEAIYLHEDPRRELKLQAIRIGELGITAIPDEVYGLTGLKIKARSPFAVTMNIGLANGSEGYIPPPEQHVLGGYTTWPARTAALEVQAEPRIVNAVLGLLEQVSGRSRRSEKPASTAHASVVLASRPVAYWRLDEMEGPRAHDATGHEHHALYENGAVFFLPGVDLTGPLGSLHLNRAPHFAGGRLVAHVPIPKESFSIAFWFWNGLPDDARPITGYLCSLMPGDGEAVQLGLGGTSKAAAPGHLFVDGGGNGPAHAGPSRIELKTWHHVALVRSGGRLCVFLDGRPEPEIVVEETSTAPTKAGPSPLHIGSGRDREASFEGKIDEAAVFDRALSPVELAEHVHAASHPMARPPR